MTDKSSTALGNKLRHVLGMDHRPKQHTPPPVGPAKGGIAGLAARTSLDEEPQRSYDPASHRMKLREELQAPNVQLQGDYHRMLDEVSAPHETIQKSAQEAEVGSHNFTQTNSLARATENSLPQTGVRGVGSHPGDHPQIHQTKAAGQQVTDFGVAKGEGAAAALPLTSPSSEAWKSNLQS